MSNTNDINPKTLAKKYKKKHFTEINTKNTIQDKLLTKYVKYNRGRERPTFFANVLEYLDYEENEFIIQSNINDHYYYKTKTKKNNIISLENHTNKNLDNRNR
jgi:hypothetical protein